MNNSPFKKSSISEMCKQIQSAPVFFRKNDGTLCLAFYNHEDSIQATKLYMMFPDTSFPKYIEGNDLYNLKDSIIHGVAREAASTVYASISKAHKEQTVQFITALINKAPLANVDVIAAEPLKDSMSLITHTVYNKKHACAWIYYQGILQHCYVKDLVDKKVSELIIGTTIEYDIEVDKVLWAAGISSKEFTALKKVIRTLYA